MKMHSPCIVLAATALVAGQGGREEIEKVNNWMVIVVVGVMVVVAVMVVVGLMMMMVVVMVVMIVMMTKIRFKW